MKKLDKAIQAIQEECGSSSFFWGDRLLTFDKTCGFLKEESFKNPFSLLMEGKDDLTIAWRLHTLIWAVKQAFQLEGDLVECGTFLGDMAWMIVQYFNFGVSNKKFYLFDSFEGLHKTFASAKDYPPHMGTFDFLSSYYKTNSNYESVVKRFAAYKNVIITKGFLPEALEINLPKKIAFLHIDLNSPQPEYMTMVRLYDLLVPGAVVIYDDYGWSVFEKQKQAADQFAKEKGLNILELPTGQGLLIKH